MIDIQKNFRLIFSADLSKIVKFRLWIFKAFKESASEQSSLATSSRIVKVIIQRNINFLDNFHRRF